MAPTLLYRLEVAPLVILPLTRSPFFSYVSDQVVPQGSLVSISFGTQTLNGVVFQCQVLPGKKPLWMKSLTRVIHPALLTETQRTLALDISEEYFTPLGRTLIHFLPKRVTARKQTAIVRNPLKVLRGNKAEQALQKKFLSQKSATSSFLDTSSFKDSKKVIALLVQAIAKKEQVLVLVPEILLLFGVDHTLKTYFPAEKISVLHSKLSAGNFWAAWERIRSGQSSIILATRQGLFAPFQRLGAIIVLEEQDESYKQWDMSPRYHGKSVAARLSTLTRARLLYVSGTPSVETLWRVQEKTMYALTTISDHADISPALRIINLKLERYRRNFSPLSEELALALHDTVARGEQALLYINRQGMNAFSVCERCKNVFRCPSCDHPLTSTKDGSFRCTACGSETTLFPSCPACHHLAFRHVGFGTEKVEKEVRKLLPMARITRLDGEMLRSPKLLETSYREGRDNNIDVLVGTQVVLKDPPLPKLSLIAMIDADSMLLFPDFQADERLFRDLSRAVHQVAHLPTGKVYVQTFRPEGAFFQKIREKKSLQVLSSILAERQELFYPPFFRFLSLTYQEKTEKKALTLAQDLYSEIQKILPKEFRLSTPRLVTFVKKRNLFEFVVLLRFPVHMVLPPALRTLLKQRSKDCSIDVDPLSLK
ncbi:MAG: primosomal protein N' [Candidatus Moranbacteria bacterium]|nr:primosomal protein N' [Candidatus Moranbacteria bacterium]